MIEAKSEFNKYFDLQLLSANQSAFEEWFVIMAGYVFGTDFERIKPGGSKGDKKCDGRRVSTETLYQCYAPESPKTFAAKAAKKISDSFPDILTYWPNTKEWIFVHNNTQGLPVSASDQIEGLRQKYPQLRIATGDRSFLKAELHDRLSLQQMLDVYPNAHLSFESVQMEHIKPLLRKIVEECGSDLGSLDFGEIPDEAKLEFNELSEASKSDIRRAQSKIHVVQSYLSNQSVPANVSIVQNAMRNKYAELVSLGYCPDEVLGCLCEYVRIARTSEGYSAAFVIVAYFFDTCDIFRNVPVDQPC